jgi:hypothetical protein
MPEVIKELLKEQERRNNLSDAERDREDEEELEYLRQEARALGVDEDAYVRMDPGVGEQIRRNRENWLRPEPD